MDISGRLVDLLPARLWSPSHNLWVPPLADRLIGHWHLCVGADPGSGRSVRTIERNGRVLLRGKRPFDFAAHAEK